MMESNDNSKNSNSVEVEERTVENSIINQQHSIIQTDETITVIVDETFVNGSEKASKVEVSPTSSTDEKKQRKKSVKFESDENIKKFIDGEEIVDQENPFKDENHELKRFIIKKKSKSPSGADTNGAAKNSKIKTIVTVSNGSPVLNHNNENSEFITKEEILRQSKYVPVYIKNPDRVLTYDKSVLEALAAKKDKSFKAPIKRGPPVPMPRKSITTNNTASRKTVDDKKKQSTTTNSEKKSSSVRVRKLTNYPELSSIKVKVGAAEKEESLYDPNEVVLNAKKFDDLYKKIEFGSTEDLEDITEKTAKKDEEKRKESDQVDSPGNGSYTNTVNSQEFREYLKKKGLLLFPVKPERKSLNDTKEQNKSTPQKIENPNDKKRTVFRRLSNIFTKSKTSPRIDQPELKPMFPSRIDARNLVNAPQARRKVFLENPNQNPMFANNEFSAHNFTRHSLASSGRTMSPEDDEYEEDTKSSISSVLSAAAEDDSVFESPQPRRHVNGISQQNNYRKISMDKSNLYQMSNGRPRQYLQQQQQHSIVNGAAYAIPHVNREEPVPKPRISHFNPPNNENHVLLRNSAERRSLPVTRINKPVRKSLPQNNTFIPITVNNVSTPTTIIDPVTFAKINEIKKKTDEALMKNRNFNNSYQQQKMDDSFKRNNLSSQSSQHSTLPRRCQSVLDDMSSSAKNSLYSEVTLRRPNGNVNVIMRRAGLSTLDRNQVMDKIYEYYRKSVNGTPLSFQEHKNLKMRSQQASTSTSPPLFAPIFTKSLTSTPKNIHENLYAQPTRRRMSEMTDTMSNGGNDRIYDVVYGSNAESLQAMSDVDYARPRILSTQGDIVFNNKVYRPVATLQPKMTSYMHQRVTAPVSTNRSRQPQEEEEYQNDKSNRNQQNEQVDDRSRRSSQRREDRERDIRRHTLGSEVLHYSNQPQQMQRNMAGMDLEMNHAMNMKMKKGIPMRAYAPQMQNNLFDDDPGIMSEVETASTGFRRGGKQRSSLPVVRTPSKTLERPLGLVFLQYRSETKRALLPNEITSIDTVRALFVRSFPRQLSMVYLEGPNVKIYIHDSSKDMFYELEDCRSHLREIKDRSVLRLFESNEVAAPQMMGGMPQSISQSSSNIAHWGDQDMSYFSEPEFDSEFQHQHIHKSKNGKPAPYYVGATQTLPRGHVYNDRSNSSLNLASKPIRSYGSRGSLGQFPYPSDQLYSIPDGYMSSPERGTRSYEEPYYSQYGSRLSSVGPVIDEEQSEVVDDQYAMYGMKGPPNRISRNPNQMYDSTRPEEMHRIRVEHMERQLANLTGIVQKALVQNPTVNTSISQPQFQNIAAAPPFRNANGTLDDLYIREKPPKLGKSYKSVSFEKSVSFSDEIQGVAKSHSPQHMAPQKSAIKSQKSSTLPRTSSQEKDRLTIKPVAVNQFRAPDLTLSPEVYNHLRGLQKKTKDLKTEVKTLRRLAQTQTISIREDIKDTFMRIRATLLVTNTNQWGQFDQERTRLSREEEIYKQEVVRLEKDLADLEGSVEVLRGEVINRRTRVNMSAVEDMALVLSRASKTVAELKMRFPSLQQNLQVILVNEMDKVCREETFLKEEPERLDIALKRCKKLTGTLVTLKRLASVQEQRTCVDVPAAETSPRAGQNANENAAPTSNKPSPSPRQGVTSQNVAPENALDALLDELQTFAKPSSLNDYRDDLALSDDNSQTIQNTVTTKMSQSQLYIDSTVNNSTASLKRLHSYPSGSDTEPDQISPPREKPPLPERNAELLSRYNKKLPPPPPPRTSSNCRSPSSPTSPNIPPKGVDKNSNKDANDSGSESANSQDNSQRQHQLEVRHQELLKKQKQLQEQYQKLQKMSTIPLQTNAAGGVEKSGDGKDSSQTTITNKVYETDIL